MFPFSKTGSIAIAIPPINPVSYNVAVLFEENLNLSFTFNVTNIFVEFGRNSREVTFPIAKPLTDTEAPTIRPSTSSYIAYTVFCLSKIEVPFKKLNPKINSKILTRTNIDVLISFESFKLIKTFIIQK